MDRIRKGKLYRQDYRSFDQFLWYELGHEHDWWEREKRHARVQMALDAKGIKLKVPAEEGVR